MRILLVEDNPGDVRLIREKLAEAGRPQWRLQHVERLAEARARLRVPECDVVLLDLSLPESRGIETFDAVREAAPHLPVVVLTGGQDEVLGAEAVRRGAQDFLDKNHVDGRALARSICYAVERQRLLTRALDAETLSRSKTHQLEAISDTLAVFLEHGEWQDAVSLLVERAAALTDSPVALMGALVERRILRVFAGHGGSAPHTGECVELTPEDAGLNRLLETGRPVCVSLDTGAEWAPVESFLAVPLLRGGAVTGVLAVAGRPGGYRACDQDALAMLARAGDVLHEHQQRQQQQAALAERLRESQKMEAIGTLASGVAHHFNNLLMIMMGNSELIAKSAAPDSPARRHADTIQQTGKRAAELIGQMIASRPKPALRMRARDLNELTANTLQLVGCVVPPGIRVRFEPYALPGLVEADPAQIEQVLLNLIVNARDAMPSGGEIIVETSHVNVDGASDDPHLPPRPGRYALVSVSDTGCGISGSVLPRVFEPFFSTRPQGGGTGLGLFAVWGTLQDAGGHVSVDSELGRGTTVRVFLPRADAPPVQRVDACVLAAAPQGRETILVVDDDGEVRDRVTGLLRRSGYTVLEAAHVGEALQLAEDQGAPIDLLVTELITPTTEGRELARRLESLAGRMKVLYMAPGEAASAPAPGVRAQTIRQPFDELTLASRVRELLDAPFILTAH